MGAGGFVVGLAVNSRIRDGTKAIQTSREVAFVETCRPNWRLLSDPLQPLGVTSRPVESIALEGAMGSDLSI